MTNKPAKPVVSLRQRALSALSRREHSRQELARKLAAYIEDGDDTGEAQITAVLDDFQQRGWLSDQRFAEQVAHAKTGRYGRLKVAHALREKGVAEDLVAQAIDGLDDVQSARAVWQKRFGVLPESREAWAKQARFLQSRGFGFDVIKRVLKSDFED